MPTSSAMAWAITGCVAGSMALIFVIIAALLNYRRLQRLRLLLQRLRLRLLLPAAPAPSASDEQPSGFSPLMDQVPPRSMSGQETVASSLPEMTTSLLPPYVRVFVPPCSAFVRSCVFLSLITPRIRKAQLRTPRIKKLRRRRRRRIVVGFNHLRRLAEIYRCHCAELTGTGIRIWRSTHSLNSTSEIASILAGIAFQLLYLNSTCRPFWSKRLQVASVFFCFSSGALNDRAATQREQYALTLDMGSFITYNTDVGVDCQVSRPD